MQDECIGYLCCIKNKTPKPKWQHSETVACKSLFFLTMPWVGWAGLALVTFMAAVSWEFSGGWTAQDDLTHVSGTSFAMSGKAGILGLSLHEGNPGLFHVERSVPRGREQRNKIPWGQGSEITVFPLPRSNKTKHRPKQIQGEGDSTFWGDQWQSHRAKEYKGWEECSSHLFKQSKHWFNSRKSIIIYHVKSQKATHIYKYNLLFNICRKGI